MISYYKSKHPGLFLYIALVITSVTALLFFEITSQKIGILSIFWGGFIFMRTLSLYEVSEHFLPFTNTGKASKNSNQSSSALPHDLMRRMSGRNNLKRGIFAMRSMQSSTLLWFVLGIAYVAYNMYLSQSSEPHNLTIKNLSVLFIIGAAFWSGQTYAYSDHASKLLIFIFASLFIVTLFKINGAIDVQVFNNLTIDSLPSIKTSALPLLAILMAYSAVMLCYSALNDIKHGINSALGITLIALLIVCGLSFETNPQAASLWVSGWSLLSIFWVRSSKHTQKSYTLYQCE